MACINIQKIKNNEIYIKLARRLKVKVAKAKSLNLKGLSNFYKRKINREINSKKLRKFNFSPNATFSSDYIKSKLPQTNEEEQRKEQLIKIFKLGKEFIWIMYKPFIILSFIFI